MLSILAVSIILPNPTDKFGDIHVEMSPTSNNFQEERARGVRDVPFLQAADGSGTQGQWAPFFGATSAGEGTLQGMLTRMGTGLQRRLKHDFGAAARTISHVCPVLAPPHQPQCAAQLHPRGPGGPDSGELLSWQWGSEVCERASRKPHRFPCSEGFRRTPAAVTLMSPPCRTKTLGRV